MTGPGVSKSTRAAFVRIALYLIAAHVAVGWGLWQLVATTDELHSVMASERAEEQVEEAVRCVDSWSIRDKIRDSDEAVLRVAAEALIAVSGADASDPDVAAYLELTEENIAEIRELIPEPDCDRNEALNLLGGS